MPINPTDTVDPGFTVNALTPIVLSLDPSRGENGVPGAPGQGMNWRGTWQTGVTYNAYDAVSRNGASYIAIVDNTSVDPATDNGSVWGVLSSSGAQGPPGPQGVHYRGAWNASTSYLVNDLATKLGTTYIAVAPSTNIDPSSDNGTHWQLFAAAGSGGDMYRASYATASATVVDHAALADTAPWSGISGKPTVGDMTKAVYDTNADNIVDKAASVPWTGVTGAPVTMPPTPHEPTHLVGGSDPLPLASSSTPGFMARGSGLTTDYYGGDNACHSLPTPSSFVSKTAAYTLTISDNNKYFVCTGGSWMLTLPVAQLGLHYYVRNDMGIAVGSTTGTITLQTNGGTIDGASTQLLLPQQECEIFSDGTNWRTFGLKRHLLLGTVDVVNLSQQTILLPLGYRAFQIKGHNLRSSGAVPLLAVVSVDGGNTFYNAANYAYGLTLANTTTTVVYQTASTNYFLLSPPLTTSEISATEANIYSGDSTKFPICDVSSSGYTTFLTTYIIKQNLNVNLSGPVNAINLYVSTGTFLGYFEVYGVV